VAAKADGVRERRTARTKWRTRKRREQTKDKQHVFLVLLAFLHPSRTIACYLRLRGLAYEGEPSNKKLLHIHPLFPCPSFSSDFDRFFDQAKSPDGPHRARRRRGRRIKEEVSGNATHRVSAYLAAVHP